MYIIGFFKQFYTYHYESSAISLKYILNHTCIIF
jgi:hypothetical protein